MPLYGYRIGKFDLVRDNVTMSKTEGIGENESIERIKEPTEAEVGAIYEEFEEVVVPKHNSRLHPVDDGEPLCSNTESHGAKYSNPKPIEAYPPGYKPLCLFCVREWRER